MDRLLGGYLLLTATAFLWPSRPSAWPVFLILHVVLGLFLLRGGPGRLRTAGRPAPLALLVAWYPLLLMPLLYWELPQLSGALWEGRFFDSLVLGWEDRIVRGQPSATLAHRWDVRAVSEILHLLYLSYYPIIFFVPAVLYFRGRVEAFAESVFALMLTFLSCYLVFTIFPVQGPRYLFPAPGAAGSGGFFYGLAHTVLESGSSRGAAFPSAHAAAAAVQTINAMRHLPAAALVLGLCTVGICVAAVYAGFHYAVDMAAGLAVGIAAGWATPYLRRVLR